jgi:hypothetical protein
VFGVKSVEHLPEPVVLRAEQARRWDPNAVEMQCVLLLGYGYSYREKMSDQTRRIGRYQKQRQMPG